MRTYRKSKTSLTAKSLFFFLIFSLFGLFFILGILFHYQKELSRYVPVNAKLEGFLREYGTTEETSLNAFHYASYSYSYRGKEYAAQRQVLFPRKHQIGKQTVILIDPDHPDKIEDIMIQRVLAGTCSVCAVASIASFFRLLCRMFS